MNIVVRMLFGSHLYRTDTPTSDRDYKGIYLPTAREILTNRIPKTVTLSSGNGDHKKNTPEDVDDDMYSLPYFLELALKGETVALDMLHAPQSAIIEGSLIWDLLSGHGYKFHTKNLKSFVGYARKQAAKYGIKGSRLAAARQALEFLAQQGDRTIGEAYHLLWEDEYCKKYNSPFFPNEPSSPTELCWVVCGKKMMEKTKCSHYVPMMKKFTDAYGERARMAQNNEGIDWKAVSHALRAGYQARHIFTSGDFTFPLPETNFLVQVKQGELSYGEIVAPELDRLMDELEGLSETCVLPDKPDFEWTYRFQEMVALDVIKREYGLKVAINA